MRAEAMTAATGGKKVVILGGGAASLTTAFELTNDPRWKDTYESITIYQMGWRLGGKCASGRTLDGRIEEHGLHILMGWYANSFVMIERMYAEYATLSPTSSPIATWRDAFKRHSLIVFGEKLKDGSYAHWPTMFGEDDSVPAQGTGGMSRDFIVQSLDAIAEWLARHSLPPLEPGPVIPPADAHPEVRNAKDRVTDARDIAARSPDGAIPPQDRARMIEDLKKGLLCLDILVEVLPEGHPTRRLCLVGAVGLASMIGILEEIPGPLGPHSLDALDEQDFRAFLRKHGASNKVANSAVVLAMYGLLFAYRDGNPDTQQLAAGTALRFIYRMVATYHGAIFWKMQAGMGDILFVPMYEVLRARGVNIELFHRVRDLEVSADGKSVERIQLGRQTTPKGAEYDPFVTVEELKCWPSTPKYDELVDGAELKAEDIDLESMWTPWVSRETPVTLQRGTDFDVVVFGISLASIPYVAPQLMQASPRWQAMHANIPTVRTQAAQLWLTRDTRALGWLDQTAVADAFPEPMNTWADMTHLLAVEGGGGPGGARNLTYFCAPMPGGIPPLNDPNAPAREHEQVKTNMIDWLTRYTNTIWPSATQKGTTGLDWSLLVDPKNRSGVQRFDAQFWRANIDPSERYVLSVPGSTRYRLKAADQDFENLFITGDWTYTGVNAGCFEGTVMSGMLTANAMIGSPPLDKIVGYDDSP